MRMLEGVGDHLLARHDAAPFERRCRYAAWSWFQASLEGMVSRDNWYLKYRQAQIKLR